MSLAVAPPRPKGLKKGALGLVSSTVIGVASTAPAYSLAATLGFIVAAVGLQTPFIVIAAFFPILFVAIGYRELNREDPDCGTTFTWAGRAFGPRTGWLGGWGIVAADVIVMASLAQIAGQYLFLLFNNQTIGQNATSGWVLLVGIGWIALMTLICYLGIELSAFSQKILLSIEILMLIVFSVVALVKVGTGNAPGVSIGVAASWFNPLAIPSFSTFVNGLLLMLFIYWGWDTAVSVNEETRDAERVPGQAAVLSTFILLATYVLVTIAAQSFAGIGTKGIGLGNPNHQGDVISILGNAVFGSHGFGAVLARLLILMVLTSSAASTQTTILPNARTTLSMAAYKALPDAFGRMHRRHLTPTVSTVAMGVVSAALYVVMNFLAKGNVIADSVSALGFFIAFYYGLTGFACVWWYRKNLTKSARNFFMQGLIPFVGGVSLFFAIGWNIWYYWQAVNSYTTWLLPFSPHWRLGGVWIIGFITFIVGVVIMFVWNAMRPEFFTGTTLRPGMVVTETGQMVPAAEVAGNPSAVNVPPPPGAPSVEEAQRQQGFQG